MSEQRKKLDKSSLGLILLALIGLGIGVWLLMDMSDSGDQGVGDKIAKVTIYKKDARVKRSTKFEWFNFKPELDFYEDDKVFTGKDSYAEIEFVSGAKIKILPNSLITLTKGQVSLNSGTIEVDSTKGKVDIESFGKKFSPPTQSKIRLENKENVQKIVPLEEKAVKFVEERPELKEMVKDSNIFINEPSFNAQVSNTGSVNFTWTLSPSDPNAEFRIDFASDDAFSNVAYTQNVTGTTLALAASILPTGTVYWKVTALAKNISAESSFNLTEPPAETKDVNIIPIKLIKPLAMDFLLEEAKSPGIDFEWTNEMNYKQKVQISRSEDFSQNLIDEDVTTTTAKYAIQEAGNFFWRVGYVIPDSDIQWSPTGQFSVIVPVTVPKLVLTVPAVMDFAAEKEYEMSVEEVAQCEDYRFIIMKKQKRVFVQTVKETEVTVKELAPGNYSAQALCFANKRQISESQIVEFNVKSRPAPEQPKIKTEPKTQIFVQVLKKIFDFIFPSAAAAENFFTFEWEEVEGAEFYNIEISNGEKSVLITEQTAETAYRFQVPGPGSYFWRVRAGRGKLFGEYSEYAELEVLDKIQRYDRPLMISPEDGEILYSEDGKTVVEFKWDEPEPDFTYEIQIYENKDSNPIMTVPVTGESQSLELPPNSFYWRLAATSSYNNSLSNQDKNFIQVEKDMPAHYDLGFGLAQSQVDFEQRAVSGGNLSLPSSISFTGPVVNINGTYYFKKSKRHIVANLDYGTLSGEGNKLTDTQLSIEYGVWSHLEHSLYFGYLYKGLDLELDGTDASYRLNFLSGRYNYQRQISGNHYFNMGVSMFVFMPPTNFEFNYAIRPAYRYQIKKSLWAEGFVEFQKLAAEGEVELPGGTRDIELTTQTMKFGAGVTWLPYLK